MCRRERARELELYVIYRSLEKVVLACGLSLYRFRRIPRRSKTEHVFAPQSLEMITHADSIFKLDIHM